jgi:hypothetical protein
VLLSATQNTINPIELLEKGEVTEIIAEVLIGTGGGRGKGVKYNEAAAELCTQGIL